MFVPLVAALLQVVSGVSGGPGNQQLQAPASATAEKDKCVVSGHVLSRQTGEPLRKASLHLILDGSRQATAQDQMTGYSATSGPDGSFRFEGLEPGDYYLMGERNGYVSASYGSKSVYSRGTTIRLQAGQQLTDLKLEMIQQATITGRVVDEDGDPVGGARVQAMGKFGTYKGKPRYVSLGNASTDETGAFRIANLEPGKYYLSALNANRRMMGMVEQTATPGKPDIQQVRTFYPSSLDRVGASPIELTAGQDIQGLEIRMRSAETFHVRGKITGEFEQNAGQPTMVMLRPNGEERYSGPNSTTMAGPDHNFDFAHIQPGSYLITVPNSRGKTARLKIEVDKADVNGLVVTPQPELTLRGSVELQGIQPKEPKDKPAENIEIDLYPAPDENGTIVAGGQAMTKADGTFALEEVMPGKFRVNVSKEPDGGYVKSIRFGGQEVLGETLDLTQATGGEIHVVIRAGASEVSGTVSVKTESGVKPTSSANVWMIPEDLTLHGGSLHRLPVNQNGGYDGKNLPPGTYYVVAFESDGSGDFDDPAVLKQLVSKGAKIELKEHDKQQLPLTVLAAEDLQAALAAGAGN